MTNGNGLASVDHVVVLMLENRSFDHMLGFLYPGGVSPSGQPFDGLTGTESNLGSDGKPVTVFRIEPATPSAYYMPGADPGEGTLGWETREKWAIKPGTTEGDIMGCFAPETVPVLSALARGYAVCDRWFSSVPTETLPNRAFACAATSQGHMDDKTHTFSSPTIFGLLDAAGQGWAIYGYDAEPLTKDTFTQISGAAASHFGKFADFRARCW